MAIPGDRDLPGHDRTHESLPDVTRDELIKLQRLTVRTPCSVETVLVEPEEVNSHE
jgi:hypothetical protein